MDHFFHYKIEGIREELREMARLVQKQLEDALEIMTAPNCEKACSIIEKDYCINEYEQHIDHKCLCLIARYQPTARDLRLIVTACKITAELERMGDAVKKLCKINLSSPTFTEEQKEILKHLEHFGSHALSMFKKTVSAFDFMCLRTAMDAYKQKEEIVDIYEKIKKHITKCVLNKDKDIEFWFNAILGCHAIERIADRSQNLCEYIFYIIKCKDLRHADSEIMQRIALEEDCNRSQ